MDLNLNNKKGSFEIPNYQYLEENIKVDEYDYWEDELAMIAVVYSAGFPVIPWTLIF